MRRHRTPERDLPAPAAWVRDRRNEAASLALSLLSYDTQNPPGHTDEVVGASRSRRAVRQRTSIRPSPETVTSYPA